MKGLAFSMLTLILLLSGCNKGTSTEDIAQLAYKWEDAKFDRDYERQQKLIYEEGSYEVDKESKTTDSGLKYDDIQYEIYYDKENDNYIVFANFKNPKGDNTVNDKLLFRKKDGGWKLDQDQSKDIDQDDVSESLNREACINCQ
ncbi:hypothetical protein [Niallia sp. 03133]|uniref:hypothetical protein n=1 Tax=Niallia sp. 03133 TaxID=3458060 RepID=UPI0040446BD3